MGNWLNKNGVSYLWRKMKNYVKDNTYPKVAPPSFYLDPDSGMIYQSGGVNVDFKVDEGSIYYRVNFGGN